jgi:hypothetical protein
MAWSSANGIEGFGVSFVYPIPAYQSNNIPNLSSLMSYRTTPDICALADPANGGVAIYNSYYSNGSIWFSIGGTSLTSPRLSSHL